MNIQNLIEKYFLEKSQKNKFENVSIVRVDGITVHSSKVSKETQANGALVAGLWQAANNLYNKGDDLRLSFGSSDSGIYIVEFSIFENRYLVSTSFEGVLNPGKLKLGLRKLSKDIESFLSENNIKPVEREEFLFTDITDEEMDRLFAHSGI